MSAVLRPIEALKDSVRKFRNFRNNTEDVKTYYSFKEKLGQGFFASVYRAVEKKSGTAVAIKVIDKSKAEDKEAMLEEEVGILGKVRHPNCVSMIEIFEGPKYLYLVMELVTGGELFQKICSRKSFSEADAARMISELCEGLRYLHSLGIVHRDLKPENILLESNDPDARIKITDFGLSKIIRGKNRFLHSRCGTPAYAAPELVEGRPYDSKVDIWAAGCILYILLTGCPPFWGADTNELFMRICQGYYPMETPQMEPISDMAKSLVRKMLVVDPQARFSADDVLKHAWITGDRKKLEFKKLSTIVSMNEYVQRHKESRARHQQEQDRDEDDDKHEQELLISTDQVNVGDREMLSSDMRGSFVLDEDEEQTLVSVPLNSDALARLEAKYSDWPDYKKEYEMGHLLGCSDLKLLMTSLSACSTWKTRALEAGLIRPFLLFVSMHPRQRFGFARLMKVDIGGHVWYGDPHREAWEILMHPLEGLRAKTKGHTSWYDTLTQVSDATLAHFWSSDKDSKKAISRRPTLGKSELKKALTDSTDRSIGNVEEIFLLTALKKLQKIKKKKDPASVSAETYQSLSALEKAPEEIREMVSWLQKETSNEALILMIVNWYVKEGYRDNGENSVFLTWVEKERSLNLSSVFLGKSRVRNLFPVVFALCLHRMMLAMSRIYLNDFYPSGAEIPA